MIMKRCIPILLCLCLACLPGCAHTGGYEQAKSRAFCGLATWEKDGLCYTARLTITEGADFTARRGSLYFLTPEALTGLTIDLADGQCILSLGGVSHPAGESAQAAFLLPFCFFSVSETTRPYQKREGEERVWSCDDGVGTYTLRLGADGALHTWQYRAPDLSITLCPEVTP